MPKTKIICTIGPASNSAGTLAKMMVAGMNVVRLNFSHGQTADHLKRIRLIRKLNSRLKKNVQILGDLEGYRIRVGALKNGAPLTVAKGQTVWLTTRNVAGQGNRIPFDYKGPLSKIPVGKTVHIDDGKIILKITGHETDALKTKVIVPGVIKERKGINLPEVTLQFDGLSESDKEHLDFCIANGIDMIAQSFVSTKDDIAVLRKHLHMHGSGIKVIAKIENRPGLKNIDEIIAASDGIMVARGDMGISIPIYEVPIIQKRIIKKCNAKKKWVITATQMLESMITSPSPTRAEVSDVANAILDGTDFVMLSAESAAGLYPVECVTMMSQIIAYTEKNKPKN